MKNILIVVVAILGILILYLGLDPLRKSEHNLRAYILDITPIGFQLEDVQKTIDEKKWQVVMQSNESGYLYRGSKPWVEVGEKYIRASIGEYRGFPFIVDVSVSWGFNGAGDLIDIWVWKTSNGL